MIMEILGNQTTLAHLKYILIFMGGHYLLNYDEGQEAFIKRKCPIQNCYVTSNKEVLYYITDFDAILFYGMDVSSSFLQPKMRSPNQIYIFWSMESQQNYPVTIKEYDNFFNWTFTHKLDSDLLQLYMIIKDKDGNIVGPNEQIDWIENDEMLPINDTLKNILKTKTKAAAWLVSHCDTKGKREIFVKNLQSRLSVYNLTIDIYGGCKNMTCDNCWDIIKSDYYFYLSFENSFSKDYVTEKLLSPLKNYTVPIVYGSANYSRFVPRGAYLNALELGVRKLATEMNDIIKNKERYYDFFRWHNHYSYHHPDEDPITDNYCRLCAALNLNNSTRVVQNFRQWWNCQKKSRELFFVDDSLRRKCSSLECLY